MSGLNQAFFNYANSSDSHAGIRGILVKYFLKNVYICIVVSTIFNKSKAPRESHFSEVLILNVDISLTKT